MTKRLLSYIVLAVLALVPMSVLAQGNASVRGKVLGEDGKPMPNVTVEYLSLDNGRKAAVKTDKKGEFFSMGITTGNYKVTFYGPDGKMIYFYNNVHVGLSGENETDLDLAKERANAEKGSGMSEEQKKQVEAAKAANEKIKGINAMLQQANAARQAGNNEEAVKIMEQAAAQDQTHDVVFGVLADSYMGVKNYPAAIDAYKKAIALAPTKGQYHNNMAQALVRTNQINDAMAEYQKAAELDPQNAGMYYFNEGAVLTNSGKFDEANTAFDKSIAADPNRADAYYQKGVNLLGKATMGKDGKMVAPDGTAEALNKYLELQPTGKYADSAKQLLASIGASVNASYGSGKKGGKK